tara:strand:+ start:193 stop:477 length:285 start_codon:yes stop_codon:yes gene_type:complete
LELEIFWEVLTDSAITCTGLRDQEVQQDDTCDKDDASPHKPEKNVNIPRKERGTKEVSSSKRHSESTQEVSDESAQMLVFYAWVSIALCHAFIE